MKLPGLTVTKGSLEGWNEVWLFHEWTISLGLPEYQVSWEDKKRLET